jgi:hypothetical protein
MQVLPKSRRHSLFAGILVIAVLGTWVNATRPWEAHYLGKPSSWWADRIRRRPTLHETLQSLGSWTKPLQVWFDGPPDLKKTLDDNPAAVAVLIELLRHSDPEVRASAAMWFPASRPELQLTFPVLADVIRNHPSATTRSHAAYRLAVLYGRNPGAFGTEEKGLVVSTLTEALLDDDNDVQCESAYALREIDPEAAARAGVPEHVTSKLRRDPPPQPGMRRPRMLIVD